GLRGGADPFGAAKPGRAGGALRRRLLTRYQEGGPAAARDRAERGEQQRRLADPGLSADQHERRGDEPAPEDAIQLRDSRGDPLGLLDTHGRERDWLRRARNRIRLGPVELLDERAESAAARALPEPAARRRATLRAGELDRDLRHARPA